MHFVRQAHLLAKISVNALWTWFNTLCVPPSGFVVCTVVCVLWFHMLQLVTTCPQRVYEYSEILSKLHYI